MIIDVSYGYQGEKPSGTINVSTSSTDLKHKVLPTRQTVGEPNQSWHIDNFTSHRLGTINFPTSGIYEITLKVEGGKEEAVKFQWLWLEKK